MPPPNNPTAAFNASLKQFKQEQLQFTATAEGRKLTKEMTGFSTVIDKNPMALVDPVKGLAGAGATLAWVERVPLEIAGSDKRMLLDLGAVSRKTALKYLSDSMQVLATGSKAMVLGATDPGLAAVDGLLQVAFGADAVAVAMRKPFIDPAGSPALPWPKDLGLPNIDKLVRGGALRAALAALAKAGIAAQDERAWLAGIKPFGTVTALRPDRACGGQTIAIDYAGFGSAAPKTDTYSDIVLALPKAGNGCIYLSLLEIARELFDQRFPWTDTGTLKVELPGEISTGSVGFFILPPALSNGGSAVGDLLAAAGELQSILGDQFGSAGVAVGQGLLTVAGRVGGGHPAWPRPEGKPGEVNYLRAGPPIIHGFTVQEQGSIHPRGTVTLTWSVENAERIDIVARSVADSANAHELPPVSGPFAASGSIRLSVPCTRRWVGEYVLRVSNGNKCGLKALAAIVRLQSGYSHYRLGVAKVDITDSRIGLGMQGFAYERQETEGVAQPIYARAFVIQRNVAGPDSRLALVVADLWTCTIAVKTAVVAELNRRGLTKYTMENVLIAGTHTHSAPAGYSEYYLYNFAAGGFDRDFFDRIVRGIADAIATAGINVAPGRLLTNTGEVADCGANRSMAAYALNSDAGQFPAATDRDLQLLKFVKDLDNLGHPEREKEIGVLNLYALHPTCLGMMNRLVSGDCHGWAEHLYELDRSGKGFIGFVAAFGTSNAGDVSGNEGYEVPMGQPRDEVRMKELGTKLCDRAVELSDAATQELTGELACRYKYLDMSNIVIDGQPGKRTWPAMMGVSFGAGSTADSKALTVLDKTIPVDIPALIPEGMTKAEFEAGGREFWPIATPLAIGLLAMIAGLPAMPLAAGVISVLSSVVSLLVASLLPERARAYAASMVGEIALNALKFPQSAPPAETNTDGTPITLAWEMPLSGNFPSFGNAVVPADIVAGHDVKPIMFPVGLATLKRTPTNNPSAIARVACPLVPQVVPIQLFTIGRLAIAAMPAEITTMAGRRLKQTIRDVLGASVDQVMIAAYANGYSGYVTTAEEYAAQHYEGASTLYGPHTLAAYQQEFYRLAVAINSNTQVTVGAPFVVPAIARRAVQP